MNQVLKYYTTIYLEEIMKIKSEYVLKELAGEYIVIPVGQEAVSFNGVITLNKSGSLLFKLLQEGAEKEDLIAFMLETYDGTEEVATKDVESFIKVLQKNNLLQS